MRGLQSICVDIDQPKLTVRAAQRFIQVFVLCGVLPKERLARLTQRTSSRINITSGPTESDLELLLDKLRRRTLTVEPSVSRRSEDGSVGPRSRFLAALRI
jgi:hypothetical protein